MLEMVANRRRLAEMRFRPILSEMRPDHRLPAHRHEIGA